MPNSWSLSNPCTNRGLCPDKPAIGRFVAKGMPPDYVRGQMAPTCTGRNLRRSGDRDSSRFGRISPSQGRIAPRLWGIAENSAVPALGYAANLRCPTARRLAWPFSEAAAVISDALGYLVVS